MSVAPRVIEQVLSEPGFLMALSGLSPDDQRACLNTIIWFERRCRQDERDKTCWAMRGSNRRRLRGVRVSKSIVAVFAVSNSGRNWVWVGRQGEADTAALRIDSLPIEGVEPINPETMLASITGASVVVADEVPSQTEIDGWSRGVERMSSFTVDARSLVGRIRSKLTARLTDAEALRRSVALAETENDKLRVAARPQTGSVEDRLAKVLSHHNAAKVENEQLRAEVKSLRKQLGIARAEATKVSGSKSADAREKIDELELEIERLRNASKKDAVAAISDDMIESIKDQCSKVLDDAANRLTATGISRMEDQADDMRKLAMRIRALKIQLKTKTT